MAVVRSRPKYEANGHVHRGVRVLVSCHKLVRSDRGVVDDGPPPLGTVPVVYDFGPCMHLEDVEAYASVMHGRRTPSKTGCRRFSFGWARIV
jgi:hypothetical protein